MPNLFLQHPKGHPTTIPCTHLKQEHPGGDKITVPCTHGLKQAHPGGDTINTPLGRKRVPCIHLVPVHPDGDTKTVPCVHLKPQHPTGDPGPTLPCAHPMMPPRLELSGGLIFYTNDTTIQTAAIGAVNRLRTLGVNLLWPRPLHVFHREPLEDGGASDPFWSHYDPVMHAIQILKDGSGPVAKRETLFHEMGHALIAHSVVNRPEGGTHALQRESSLPLAMSEGWATFVGLVLSYGQRERTPRYMGLDWETMSIAPNPKVEYCVGCCLWDLFDAEAEAGGHADTLSLPFTELFKVYSPTLRTLTSPVMVDSIMSFCERLKLNNPNRPDLAKRIDEARRRNVG